MPPTVSLKAWIWIRLSFIHGSPVASGDDAMMNAGGFQFKATFLTHISALFFVGPPVELAAR
jgi:hypothetical protein